MQSAPWENSAAPTAGSPSPMVDSQNSRCADYTAWLLDDARRDLNDADLTIIETAPPRAAGPLGDWRIVRCRHSGENASEFLVAREQLPNIKSDAS